MCFVLVLFKLNLKHWKFNNDKNHEIYKYTPVYCKNLLKLDVFTYKIASNSRYIVSKYIYCIK